MRDLLLFGVAALAGYLAYEYNDQIARWTLVQFGMSERAAANTAADDEFVPFVVFMLLTMLGAVVVLCLEALHGFLRPSRKPFILLTTPPRAERATPTVLHGLFLTAAGVALIYLLSL